MLGAGALALVSLAVFSGALINALSGFGFALVTVPLMALVVGPKDAVVLSAIVGLVSNSTVLLENRTQVDRPVAGRLLAGSLVGMPLGVVALSLLAEEPLEVMISVVVLGAVVLLATGVTLTAGGRVTDVSTGFVSGILNTSIGISGPPVILLLAGRGLPKAVFRATSVAVFSLSGVVALVLFGIAGRYDSSVFLAAVIALPALVLGYMAGDRLHDRVREEGFRLLVLVLLTLIALVTLMGALGG